MPLEDLTKFRPSGAFRMQNEGADASHRFLNPRAVYQTTALYDGVGFPAHISRFTEQRIRLEPGLSEGLRGREGGGAGAGGSGNEGGGRYEEGGGGANNFGWPASSRAGNIGTSGIAAPTLSHLQTSALPPAAPLHPHSRVEFVAFEAPVRGPTAGDVVAKTMLQRSMGELEEITKRLKMRLEQQTDKIMGAERGGGGGGGTVRQNDTSTAPKRRLDAPEVETNLPPLPRVAAAPETSTAAPAVSTGDSVFDPAGPPLYMRPPTPLISEASSQRPGPLGIWQREFRDENYNSAAERGGGGGEGRQAGHITSTTSLGITSTDDESSQRRVRYEKIVRGGEPRSYLNGSGSSSSSSSSSRASSRSPSVERLAGIKDGVVDYSTSSGRDDYYYGYPLNTNTNNENIPSTRVRSSTVDSGEGENDGIEKDASEVTPLDVTIAGNTEANDAYKMGNSSRNFESCPRDNDDVPDVSEVWDEAAKDETEVEEEVSPVFDDDFECDEDETTRTVLNDSEEVEEGEEEEQQQQDVTVNVEDVGKRMLDHDSDVDDNFNNVEQPSFSRVGML